jgi:hypothetical protein
MQKNQVLRDGCGNNPATFYQHSCRGPNCRLMITLFERYTMSRGNTETISHKDSKGRTIR